MNERARSLWAVTRLHVWPETYRLVSLPAANWSGSSKKSDIGSLLADLNPTSGGSFFAMIVEREEISLTVDENAWQSIAQRAQETIRPDVPSSSQDQVEPDRAAARAWAGEGPFRAISFDLNIDLDVTGYLAPALAALAENGVPVVPQCAFLKDHILVHERDLKVARAVLEKLIASCQ